MITVGNLDMIFVDVTGRKGMLVGRNPLIIALSVIIVVNLITVLANAMGRMSITIRRNTSIIAYLQMQQI